MSEQTKQEIEAVETGQETGQEKKNPPAVEESAGNARLVYILYLVGLVIGFTGIVGVVMAYIQRDDAPDWLKSHYDFQIRTFWYGALFMLVGLALSVVVVGLFVLIYWGVWLTVRSVKGMKLLDQRQPHPNPKGWMF